ADDRRDETHGLSRALESALGVPPLVEAGRGQVLRAVERELAVSPQVARDSRQRLRLAADRLGQPLPLGEQDVRNVVNTRGFDAARSQESLQGELDDLLRFAH